MSITDFRSKVEICGRWLLELTAIIVMAGCATSKPEGLHSRHFDFRRDTFAYANGLVWEYHYNERGEWVHQPREPKPDYSHHCFVVARSAKQFFEHARFDPTGSVATKQNYARLIHQVISRSPRHSSREDEKVVIPGYANLREFSATQEHLLQGACGGAWRSYIQRGHWRMIWPFSHRHQAKTAKQLSDEIKQGQPAVVHLVCFPSLKINHAVLLFDATETDTTIEFATYDPNSPEKPVTLTFNRSTRLFSFPTNFYFPGGRVNVYEIYHGWLY